MKPTGGTPGASLGGAPPEIVVGGVARPLGPYVRTWTDHGMSFTGPKRAETKLIVCHWTGAENPPSSLHANLLREKLGVHFAIDQVGTIWQFADTDLLLSHASGVNAFSLGIELINRGSALTLPDRGVRRAQLTETIHGKRVVYAAFTVEQVDSVCLLVAALCRAYAIPMRVPMLGDEPYPTELPDAVKARFRGVIGHLQWCADPKTGRSRGKLDPGLSLLRTIHQRGLPQPVAVG